MKKGNRQVVMIRNESYLSSRLIFFWHHGYLPIIVDHKDTNTENDNINNLRDADYFQNSHNSNKKKGVSSSKYKGFSFCNNKNWRVRLRVKWLVVQVGYFNIEIDAAIAYNNAAIKYYGEFANLNIID